MWRSDHRSGDDHFIYGWTVITHYYNSFFNSELNLRRSLTPVPPLNLLFAPPAPRVITCRTQFNRQLAISASPAHLASPPRPAYTVRSSQRSPSSYSQRASTATWVVTHRVIQPLFHWQSLHLLVWYQNSSIIL
jgi:hypothetical protein